VDGPQREALAGLRRLGFEEIFRDEKRIIMRHEKQELTESIPWEWLRPAIVRTVREKLRAGVVTRRSMPAARAKRPVRDRIAEQRRANIARSVSRGADAQQRAEEAAYRNFQFYDRLMRSTPRTSGHED
jgi:hypothetical protein